MHPENRADPIKQDNGTGTHDVQRQFTIRGEHEDCPFQDIASEELDQSAADLVRTKRLRPHVFDVAMRIEGACPRCGGDKMNQTTLTEIPASSVRGVTATMPDTVQADFLCRCGYVHPGAPAGELGCGANFTVIARTDSGA